ncbi:MFS transporter [Mangrovicoccus algicola]|uniref:MFS transporter n=1 Tax=Mangrovicoccus algicola TaxID=2771008 RepID=A0A8J6YYB7_9RHOB|nr:MFS transporter [Mangrovicoccus algicola]MBE3640042.1 MFS transporter [Mangrovicoccus algicola]
MKDSSPFAPFRHRAFLSYWLVGLAANFGWLIQTVGASWLMTSMHGAPELVALVQTSIALPLMLFSLPAGAIADTFGRRRTVMWSQGALCLISAMLAGAAFLGLLSPWGLLGFTFLIGTAKAMNNPAWQSMVSELVPKSDLPASVALNSIGFNLARSVGPAIGGVLVASVGAFSAFVVNAAANLFVLVSASRWQSPARDDRLPPEAIGSAMMAGLRYVGLSPIHLTVFLRGFLFNLAGISLMALMPLVARDQLGGGPLTYGLLLGGFGVGAILGALGASRLRAMVSLEVNARICTLGYALGTALLGMSTVFPLSILAVMIAGAAWPVLLSSLNTTVQLSSPRWVLSRCLAIYQSCNFAGFAIGGWIWGMTAGQIGTGGALVAAAAGLLAVAAFGLVLPLRTLDTSRLDPHSRWSQPEPEIDMVPKSGPIITSIAYRIAEEDVEEFLSLMAERRRGRIRDGARRWTLSRDLLDPELWHERFKTPTWIETQRHHARRTVAGADIAARLKALHRGPDAGRVHYELVRPASPPPAHEPVLATEA